MEGQFYTVGAGHTLTGDSVAQVLSQLKKAPSFNRAYLIRHLSRGLYLLDEQPTETLFCEIQRTPHTGQYLTQAPAVRYRKDSDYTEHFLELFKQAIRRCSPTGTIGVELSGGLDSSSIAAMLAHEYSPGSLIAFSNGLPAVIPKEYQPSLFDESVFSKTVARHLSLKQLFISEGYDFGDAIDKLTRTLGTFSPVIYPILAYKTFEKARELGVTNMFSGFGGDELVTQTARQSMQESRYERLAHRLRYFSGKHRMNRSGIDLSEYFSDEIKSQVKTVNTVEFASFKTVKEVEWDLTYGRYAMHLHERVQTSKIIAKSYGITLHFPMLDPDLMAFCHGIPNYQKRRHGMGRYLVRRAMKDYLPVEIAWRKDKLGQTVPSGAIDFERQLPELMRKQFSNSHSGKVAELIRLPKLLTALEQPKPYPPEINRLCLMTLMLDLVMI